MGVGLVDGVLALSQSVPQLDGLVARARDNLSVIGRESHRQNIVGVSLEAASGFAHVQIP